MIVFSCQEGILYKNSVKKYTRYPKIINKPTLPQKKLDTGVKPGIYSI